MRYHSQNNIKKRNNQTFKTGPTYVHWIKGHRSHH
uniref:Uncharacterized protein n=1 Tax=Anguilla anguilla TaxID=7936 RepID=A0A0E9VUU4_ANGAN